MRKLVDQLIRHEGEREHAYTDHLGFLTIGVGRCIDKRRCDGISHEEIMHLLANDIKACEKDLASRYPWTQHLMLARLDVLLNMRFQLGARGFSRFTKTLDLVKRGMYVSAAQQMLRSKVAKQQAPARWKELAEQMRTGQYQA